MTATPVPRLALLAEGRFTALDAKTAVGILRYRPADVAAVVDSTRAGSRAQDVVGAGGDVPVVADLDAAAARGAGALVVGTAPQGGELPAAWRAVVMDALDRGWDVVSGLHEFLGDDPELAALSRAKGGRLIDVRRPPARRPIAARRAAGVEATVVLTVGSDCNVGKMTVSLETRAELERRSLRAAFVATGQTGIMIEGRGVAVDAVPADFVAGLTEEMVLEAARDADVVLVEGQGSLLHPGYSGVTLGLLHGACPSAMILCHQAGRERIRRPGAGDPGDGEPAFPPLAELARLYEQAAAWVRPSRVIAVALNTMGLDERAARAAVAEAAADTGLPATDPVRFGAGPLAEAIAAGRRSRAAHA